MFIDNHFKENIMNTKLKLAFAPVSLRLSRLRPMRVAAKAPSRVRGRSRGGQTWCCRRCRRLCGRPSFREEEQVAANAAATTTTAPAAAHHEVMPTGPATLSRRGRAGCCGNAAQASARIVLRMSPRP